MVSLWASASALYTRPVVAACVLETGGLYESISEKIIYVGSKKL